MPRSLSPDRPERRARPRLSAARAALADARSGAQSPEALLRIVSLVPSVTEILFALGLGESVVGVSHACDFPAPVLELPRVTRPAIASGWGLDGGRIDEMVGRLAQAGEPVVDLDPWLIRELEPDLVIGQDVCSVCATSGERARRELSELYVVSQSPATLDGVYASIEEIAGICGAGLAGSLLVEDMRGRVAAVAAAAPRPPLRAVFLEWLDPPFTAGHWTPELTAAAGLDDPLGRPGRDSLAIGWSQVTAATPEVLVVAPCGMAKAEAEAEAERMRGAVQSAGAGQVIVLDGNAWFSRPGPRLVEGLEQLAGALSGGRALGAS